MPQEAILVELDSTVRARLDALAQDLQRPVSEVAADVISMYLAPDSWEHEHIRAGLAELEAGNGVSNEQVSKWLDSWGTENELPAPK
jgi:predicted transcriptional regulator